MRISDLKQCLIISNCSILDLNWNKNDFIACIQVMTVLHFCENPTYPIIIYCASIHPWKTQIMFKKKHSNWPIVNVYCTNFTGKIKL